MSKFQAVRLKPVFLFVALSTFLTAVLIALNWTVYKHAVLRQDEIALHASAFQSWTSWFTSGFANYFNPYPEFSATTTNFIRPVINIFYLIFRTFDVRYSSQIIILCYATHAMTVAVLFLAIQRHSLLNAIISALIMFFVGSFWPFGLNSPVYGSEFLATLLTLLAILSLLNRLRAVAILLLLLSILTKETSLPVIAGLTFITFVLRDYRTSFWLAILIVAFLVFRKISFGSFIGGVYVSPALSIKSLLTVFTFPITYGSLTQLKNTVLAREFASIQIFIILNFAIFGIITRSVYVWRYACVDVLSRIRSKLFEGESAFMMLLVCFLASLTYYVFVARVARFSYQTTALFLLVLSLYPLQVERSRILVVTLIGSLIGFGETYRNFYGHYDVDLALSEVTRRLKQNVQSLESSNRVYTVNDVVTGYSKPSDFALILGSQIDLQKGSSIEMGSCAITEWQNISVTVEVVGQEKRITTALPPCAAFVFEGADRRLMQNLVKENTLIRNQHIEYRFHAINPNFSLSDVLMTKDRFPDVMTVHVKEASILYFDFKTQDWRFVE